MYAIRDGTLKTPRPRACRSMPRADIDCSVAAAGVAGCPGRRNGWYNDLPAGQRIVNDPQADLNLVAYARCSVQPDPCLTSLACVHLCPRLHDRRSR